MKYKLKIIQDQDIESPREWDNLGTMYCEHRRYNLGDEDADDIRNDEGEFDKDVERNYIILPLYLYDHSGITMNTTGFSCPWDSGQVGYIYVSRADVRKEFGVKVISPKLYKRVVEILESEVATYDQYLTGDVYGFKLIAIEDGEEDETGDEVDSCWGFYGSDPTVNGMSDHLMVSPALCEVEYEYC